jgi:adenylate cyclase
VRDHVQDKLQLRFEDMGEQLLRNIARPVRVFHIRTDGSAAQRNRKIGSRGLLYGAAAVVAALAVAVGIVGALGWPSYNLGSLASLTAPLLKGSSVSQIAPAQLAPALSIVVLPFTNLGGDQQQDYLVDGITDSLITDLSRALPGSFVVARGTAFTYKGRAVDTGQVGRDLNVRYLLRGSVIADADRVRVNAQLIESQTSTELWAERFDKKRQNALEIQDQIVGRLSRAVGLQLVDIEARRSERERPGNPTAVDFVMRGQAIANRPASPQTMTAARAQLQRAIDYDSDNVDALAGLAATYVFEVLNSYYEEGRDGRLREPGYPECCVGPRRW